MLKKLPRAVVLSKEILDLAACAAASFALAVAKATILVVALGNSAESLSGAPES